MISLTTLEAQKAWDSSFKIVLISILTLWASITSTKITMKLHFKEVIRSQTARNFIMKYLVMPRSSNSHKQIQWPGKYPISHWLFFRRNKKIIKPNATNMASKHFPVDFFNQKMKKQPMHNQPTNDETIGNSFDNERGNLSDFQDHVINDYVMKTSLTIDYDKPVEIGEQMNNFI